MAGIFSVNTLTLAFVFLLNKCVLWLDQACVCDAYDLYSITVQGIAVFTPTIVRTIFPGRTTVQQVSPRSPHFP